MPEPDLASPLPSVAVLFVARNQIEELRASLTTLAVQDAAVPLQSYVVDAGSTDGTVALDQEFANVNVLRMPRYFGRTRALNMGVRATQADYVLFAEPGVQFPAGSVASLLGALEDRTNGIAVLRTAATQLGALSTPEDLYEWWRSREHRLQPADLPQAVLDAALLVQRSFVQGMNFFDEKYGEFFPYLELFAQSAKAGRKLWIHPDTAVAPAPLHPYDRAVRLGALLPEVHADCLNGVCVYASKRGKGGLGMRVQGIFASLFDFSGKPGSGFGSVVGVLNGSKVDGI